MKHLLHGFSIALLIATAFLFIPTQIVQGQNDCEVVAQVDTFTTIYSPYIAPMTDGWTFSPSSLLANDSDSCNGELTITGFSNIQNGSSISTYNNEETETFFYHYYHIDFLEPFIFDYEVCNEAGDCSTSTAYVYVTELIVAIDDYMTTSINTPVTIDVAENDIILSEFFELDNANCFDGDFETENGTITILPNNNNPFLGNSCIILYTPNENFVGTDSFEYATFLEFDGATDYGTVYITVEPNELQAQNHEIIFPPFPECENCKVSVENDSLIVSFNELTEGAFLEIVANDIIECGIETITIIQEPEYAIYEIIEGYLYYHAYGSFEEYDVMIYQICDSNGNCDQATINVTLPCCPNAQHDDVVTPVNEAIEVDVLANDFGTCGNDFFFEQLTFVPLNGSAVLNPDGTITYIPNDGFVGEDGFAYTICDNFGCCDLAYVFIEVIDPENQNRTSNLSILNEESNSLDCEVDLGPDLFTCLGGSVTLAVSNGTSYLWSNGETSSSIDVSPNATTDYSVTVTDSDACTASDSITVTVSSLIIDTGLNQSICFGEVATISASNAVFYSWNTGATSQSFTVVPNQTTTYSVTATDANGCTDSGNVTVFVNDINIEVGGNQVICEGETATLSVSGGFSYNWNTGATTPTINVSPSTDVIYYVTATNPFGCSATGNTAIFVTPAEDCQQAPCQPACSNTTAEYSVPQTAGSTYEWQAPGANNLVENDNEVQISWGETGDGSIKIIETQANGISDSTTICIDIVATPTAEIASIPAIQDNTISVCSGQNIQFSATNVADANEFLWIFGDGSTAENQNTTHLYAASGMYEVQLVANSDCMCSDTTSVFVNVDEAITPQIDCTGTVCRGDIMTYETAAVCGNYFWNISEEGTVIDGGTENDNFVMIHWLGNDNIGIIELTVSDCTEAYCEIPARYEIPIVGNENLNISGVDFVCSGDIAVYSVPKMSGISYNWNDINGGEFLSGTTANEVSIQWTGSAEVDAFVSLEIENCFLGCSANTTFSVDIRNVLDLFVPEQTACENESITIYSTILGNEGGHPPCDWTITTPTQETIFIENEDILANYEWENGAGTYHIEIVPTNPTDFCNEKASASIDIVSPPPAPTAISGETIICPDDIYNYSVPNNEDYLFIWNVVNGNETTETQGNAINVIFNNAETHEIQVAHQAKAFPFCQSDFTVLEINNLENELELTGSNGVCLNNEAAYTATLNNNNQAFAVTWQISPSTAASIIEETDTQIFVQWYASGTISATYCGAIDSVNVEVFELPEPEIIAAEGVCLQSQNSISTSILYETYLWYRDSVFYSSSPTPDITEGGYYHVEVINGNGCLGSASTTIDTYPIPEAFVSSPDFVDVCDDIFTLNLYTAISNDEPYHYQWYQNGTEVGTDTSHYFTPGIGNYYVVVTNIYGCAVTSNTFSINDGSCPTGGGGGGPTCTIPTAPSFTHNTSEYCDSILFQNTSIGSIPNTTSWNFNYPFGGTSTLESPNYLYDKVGYYTVVMYQTYENATPPPSNCTVGVAENVAVTIKAKFEANTVCIGDTTVFKDLSTYLDGHEIVAWEWNFGNNNTSTAQNPEFIYEEVGMYIVSLEITSNEGCIDKFSQIINVLPPPTATIISDNQICQGISMTFQGETDSSLGLENNISSWKWNFGDENNSVFNGNTSTNQNTNHVFNEAGIYEVSLTVTNVFGCSFTTTKTVEILENGLNGEILLSNPSPICIGDSTVLSFSENNENLSYQWSNGSTDESITVFASNVYELTVTDEIGCSFHTEQAVVDIVSLPNNILSAFVEQTSGDFSVYTNEVEVCKGSTVTIEAYEENGSSYLWSNNTTASSISIETENWTTNENAYSVTITNETGCESFADFTIKIREVPAVFGIISLAESNCLEEGETIALEIPNPQDDLTYFWNNGTYGTSTVVSSGGTYFATAVNETGCETNSNVIVIHDVPNACMLQTGCFTECSPKEICLATSNIPLSSYQWLLDGTPIANANDDNFMATENGLYQVELISEAGCTSITEGLNLTLEDCSVCDVTVGDIEELCNPQNQTYTVFFNVSGGQAPYTITGSYDAAFIDTTIVQQSPELPKGTSYEITVTDALGCAFSFANFNVCETVPVELINFSGRMTENANLLEWKTASEINNDFFTLSRKTADENDFVAIAKIKANGNSSISKKYNYTDAFTESGLVQYQLSQTDFDGTTKKVGTISLVRSARALQILEVSPVPTHDFVVIKYILPESSSESRLSLFDMHGRKVYEKSLANNEQSQQQEVISLSQLSSGVYTLSLENGTERVIEKVVKY
ncbi:MAG: PKD domain-containing protein [Chitinophagales bacterium]